MVLGIKQFERLNSFEKSYRRLRKQTQTAVERAVGDLLSDDELPPGRRLEKVKSSKNAWAVRVSRGIRLTFEVADGICILRNVGGHNKTLDDS